MNQTVYNKYSISEARLNRIKVGFPFKPKCALLDSNVGMNYFLVSLRNRIRIIIGSAGMLFMKTIGKFSPENKISFLLAVKGYILISKGYFSLTKNLKKALRSQDWRWPVYLAYVLFILRLNITTF